MSEKCTLSPLDGFNNGKPQRIGSLRIVNRFDLNHRHGRLIARIVTSPFAERPFGHNVFDPDFAFDGDLGIGGNRQTRERPVNNLQRLTENAAGVIILVDPVGHVGRCHDEIDRMMAE